MRNRLAVVLSLVVGALLGFFGVLVSVFADGGQTERLITISIILAIYAVLGAIWGFFSPEYSWRWGLLLGAPGLILLVLYTIGEPNPYHFVYAALLIALPCLTAYVAATVAKRRK